MEGDDLYLSAEKIAILHDKNVKTIYRWIEDSQAKKQGSNYSLKDIISYREEQKNAEIAQSNGGAEEAKARLLNAQADMAELKYKEALKDVVPLSVAQDQFFTVIDNLKSALLSLPEKFKQRTNIPVEQSRLLEKMIKDILLKVSE